MTVRYHTAKHTYTLSESGVTRRKFRYIPIWVRILCGTILILSALVHFTGGFHDPAAPDYQISNH